jgi:hypothetical protein
MQEWGKYEVSKCGSLRWRILVVVLSVFALTISLSTRTFRLTVPQVVTAQSNAPQAVRQHLDRDAVRWLPSAPVLTFLQAPTFYPHVAPAGPPLPAILFHESFYNRPPPSC